MKIVIFGGTGFVGSEVIKEALKQKYIVTSFSRKVDLTNKNNNLISIKGDVLNYSDVKNVVKN